MPEGKSFLESEFDTVLFKGSPPVTDGDLETMQPDYAVLAEAITLARLNEMAGTPPMPMLREKKDRMNRRGYAYEGEELLFYVKPRGSMFVVVASPLTRHFYPRAVLTEPCRYDEALACCYLEARKYPAGLTPAPAEMMVGRNYED